MFHRIFILLRGGGVMPSLRARVSVVSAVGIFAHVRLNCASFSNEYFKYRGD